MVRQIRVNPIPRTCAIEVFSVDFPSLPNLRLNLLENKDKLRKGLAFIPLKDNRVTKRLFPILADDGSLVYQPETPLLEVEKPVTREITEKGTDDPPSETQARTLLETQTPPEASPAQVNLIPDEDQDLYNMLGLDGSSNKPTEVGEASSLANEPTIQQNELRQDLPKSERPRLGSDPNSVEQNEKGPHREKQEAL